MAWYDSVNPWSGGRYDLSNIPGAIKNAYNNPILAASNVAGRLLSGQGVGALVPQTVLHDRAADTNAYSGVDSGDDTDDSTGDQLPGSTNSTRTGSGSGTAADFRYIDGIEYNINNPSSFLAYIAHAERKLNEGFDQFRGRQETLRDEDIFEAVQAEERLRRDIERAITKVGEQEGIYEQDYIRSLDDLAEGFRQGTARRQSFYAAISPRAYQSAQGSSQEYAQGKYEEGQGRYAEDRARAMQGFRETREDYAQQRQDAAQDLNLFRTRRQREFEDTLAEQAAQTQAQRDALIGGAKSFSTEMGAGGSRSRWTAPTFQERNLDYSPSQVNLNDLMQFIKFQPVGAQANAPTNQFAQTAAPVATPEAGGPALAQYMGYQEPASQPNQLNLYKKGQALI